VTNGCIVGELTVKIDPPEKFQRSFDVPKQRQLTPNTGKNPGSGPDDIGLHQNDTASTRCNHPVELRATR